MGHQIIEIRSHGARRKVLVQECIPVYYPNLYVTLEQSGRALNTQQKYLEHMRLFEDFLEYESISLIIRLEERPQSRYLTDSEISRFVADAALYKITLDKKYTGVRPLPTAYRTVSRIHAQQRLEAVRDYLNFLYDKLGDEATRDAAVDYVERRFNRKIKAAKPSWKKSKNEGMKGLTNQERDRLLEVMHPDRAEAERFWNFPYAAIEETVVNAVYHRSYEIREPIEIRIDKHELLVLSFPGPDRSIKLADLQQGRAVSSRYRNRRIVEFLKELDLTEGRSTGLPKILRVMQRNGSPAPVFETDDERSYFLIRLPMHAGFVASESEASAISAEATEQVTHQVKALLLACLNDMNRAELMQAVLA